MSAIPPTRDALVFDPATKKTEVKSIQTPTPGEDEVLVRVHAVALNLVDSLFITSMPLATNPRVVGTDFSGEVVAVGAGVPNNDKRGTVGAKVYGFLQGATSVNDAPGAFAQYITVQYDLTARVPLGMSWEQAAALPMCTMTAAQAVWFRQKLPSPLSGVPGGEFLSSTGEPVYFFIYGATTSLGMYAAQIVRAAEKVSGRRVLLIGAASARHEPMLRAAPYRYDLIVDYHDPQWVRAVRAATGDRGVDYALDIISEGDTPRLVHETLAETARWAVFKDVPGCVEEISGPNDTFRIPPLYGAAWEALGKDVHYPGGRVFRATVDRTEFAKAVYKWLDTAADDGEVKVQPNPIRHMPGGLNCLVPDGVSLLGTMNVSARGALERDEPYMKPVSGEKMVYTVD